MYLPDFFAIGWDTKLIFKRSKAGLNSEFSFFYTGNPTKAKESSWP